MSEGSVKLSNCERHQTNTLFPCAAGIPIHKDTILPVTASSGRSEAEENLCNFHTDREGDYQSKILTLKGQCEQGFRLNSPT